MEAPYDKALDLRYYVLLYYLAFSNGGHVAQQLDDISIKGKRNPRSLLVTKNSDM